MLVAVVEQESERVFSNSFGRCQHITQYDMSVVHTGFFSAMLLYHRQFGAHCSHSDLEDYAFFWRVLGFLFGVSDQYNVCAAGGLNRTLAACREIEAEVTWKALRDPAEGWKEMSDAYVSGVNLFLAGGLPLGTTESLVAFRIWMMGRKLPEWLKLTWIDWCRVWMLKIAALMILWIPGFERLMNLLAFALYRYSVRLVSKQLDNYAGQDFRS